jgi:excinuclease ABC subunit A
MNEQGKTFTFLAPIIRGIKGTHEKVLEDLKKDGYTKVRVDQQIYDIEQISEIKMERYVKHWIEAVIDTVEIDNEERSESPKL